MFKPALDNGFREQILADRLHRNPVAVWGDREVDGAHPVLAEAAADHDVAQ
jgi:hypothetical protein